MQNMHRIFSITFKSIQLSLVSLLFITNYLAAQDSSKLKVSVKLRGVYDSKITLTPFDGRKAVNPVAEIENVKNGDTGVIYVPAKHLPGEFVLRLDYRSKKSDHPYPSEKYIYLYRQDIFLDVNPPYINNKDSTVFEKNETENNAYQSFTAGNNIRRQQLDLLKQFLLGYDDNKSKFYQQGIAEFEKRRKAYNKWIGEETKKYDSLYVSRTFMFQYMPSILWQGSENERVNRLTENYFEGIDFSDTLIIRLRELNTFMSAYMGLYGAQATTTDMRDSMFTQAGRVACQKASQGHPVVYGWMVDYFYSGYETYNIKPGMNMLQKHIDNPSCLTSKKQQIIKRLEGMSKLVANTKAPDFTLFKADSSRFNLYSYKASAPLKLLLFWSAACEHCQQLTASLKPWYDIPENKVKIDIIAISLDDTEDDIKTWKNKIDGLPQFIHLMSEGGVNSEVASAYYLLSTPVMFVLDSETNIIKTVPTDFEALKKSLE